MKDGVRGGAQRGGDGGGDDGGGGGGGGNHTNTIDLTQRAELEQLQALKRELSGMLSAAKRQRRSMAECARAGETEMKAETEH